MVFGPVGGGQTAPAKMLKYFGAEKPREQIRSALTEALRWSPFHRHWLKRMSFVLAANQDTLNIVRALGCKNTSLMCDTAISADYFAHGPRSFEERSGAFKLLWVGRMLTRKALPLALDAVGKVRQNVTLTIAGEGIDPSVVHQMIRDRNLQHRVFWKGERLTWTELQSAYAEHDAMIFTSFRDSFGSQVLEAMAMGLPIITLDLHGAHDWVPNEASLKVHVAALRKPFGTSQTQSKSAFCEPLRKGSKCRRMHGTLPGLKVGQRELNFAKDCIRTFSPEPLLRKAFPTRSWPPSIFEQI